MTRLRLHAAYGMSFSLHSQRLVVFPQGFSSTVRRVQNCSDSDGDSDSDSEVFLWDIKMGLSLYCFFLFIITVVRTKLQPWIGLSKTLDINTDRPWPSGTDTHRAVFRTDLLTIRSFGAKITFNHKPFLPLKTSCLVLLFSNPTVKAYYCNTPPTPGTIVTNTVTKPIHDVFKSHKQTHYWLLVLCK